jgi:hypothetical protein
MIVMYGTDYETLIRPITQPHHFIWTVTESVIHAVTAFVPEMKQIIKLRHPMSESHGWSACMLFFRFGLLLHERSCHFNI